MATIEVYVIFYYVFFFLYKVVVFFVPECLMVVASIVECKALEFDYD